MNTPLEDLSFFIHAYTPPLFFAFLCLCLAGFLFAIHRPREGTIFIGSFFVTVVLVTALKYVFAVPRPTDALIVLTDYAFPSSHAAFSAFLATTLGWLLVGQLKKYQKPMRLIMRGVLYVPAIVVAGSRLVIGVHTPFQVAVGFALGILIPLSVIYAARVWWK